MITFTLSDPAFLTCQNQGADTPISNYNVGFQWKAQGSTYSTILPNGTIAYTTNDNGNTSVMTIKITNNDGVSIPVDSITVIDDGYGEYGLFTVGSHASTIAGGTSLEFTITADWGGTMTLRTADLRIVLNGYVTIIHLAVNFVFFDG